MQTDGGPIGLRVTNAVARVRMIRWAKDVLKILEGCSVKVHLCKSYVDDVRFLLEKIVRGYKYEPAVRQLIYDPAYEEKFKSMNDYQYSSVIMIDIMNSVSNDMKFTMEDQTQYSDKRLPTLDFTLKYSTKGIHKIQYTFYKKPMASKHAILKSSALSDTVKKNTIT